jgi:DnaJ-class molecular chaperone
MKTIVDMLVVDPNVLPALRKALTGMVRCPSCGGSGTSTTYRRGGEWQRQEACRACEGRGSVVAATGESR